MNDYKVASIKGKRDYMEDTWYYNKKNGITIAFICDGHGGDTISKLTREKLANLLFNNVSNCASNYQIAVNIRNTIIQYSETLKNITSGSTLTGILKTNSTVFIYNIGDSRTCIKLGPNTIVYMLNPIFNFMGDFDYMSNIVYNETNFFSTIDHDTDNVNERNRVLASGGTIKNDRVNNILAVTRALGDTDIGPGVSAVPDVWWIKKQHLKGPILMFSDGIYEPGKEDYKLKEHFTNERIYNIAITKGLDTLIQYVNSHKSEDNMTALMVMNN